MLLPGTSLAFLATVLLFVALSYGGATITSIMATSEIVFSFLTQVLVMMEPASLLAILGAILVLVCMILLVLEDVIISPRKILEIREKMRDHCVNQDHQNMH